MIYTQPAWGLKCLYMFTKCIHIKYFILLSVLSQHCTLSFSQTFSWAKSVTTTATHGEKIVCDKNGNVVTVGQLYSYTTDMDFGPAIFNLTPGIGNTNGYIAKYTTNGDLMWAKLIFSQNVNNSIRDLKLDKNNNVYIIGKFKGTIDFDPGPGIFNMTNSNQNNFEQLFVEKLDSNGTFIWAKQIGDTINNTYDPALAVTSQGDVIITDGFIGTIDFDPGPAVYNMTADNIFTNTYLLKLNTNGQFVWAKQFTAGHNLGLKVITDSSDNIYMMGKFFSVVDADPNAGVQYLFANSQQNAYVIKLTSYGQHIWSSSISNLAYFGGLGINDIYLDRYNNVYYSGFFSDSVDFYPGITGVDVLTSMGVQDAFVSKLDSNGSYNWTKAFGGTGNDKVDKVIVDTNDYCYVMGEFVNTVDFNPSVNGVYNLTGGGNVNTFVSKFDSGGTFINVKNFGNNAGFITGKSICIDFDNNIFMTGEFGGTQDFDPGANVFNITAPGINGFMFMEKFGFCGTYHDTAITHCNTINLWGNNYDSSQQFVQMFANDNACDSNLNVALTIIYGPTDTLYQTECNSFTINNITYSTSGLHVQNYPIGGSCDSLFVINLNLTNPGITNITQVLDTLQVFPSGYSYQWFDCLTNLPVLGAIDSIFVPVLTGSYKAVVYFGAGCSDTTLCKVISKGESVNDFSLANFSIKPNPTKGHFEIVNKEYKGSLTVKITDIFGNIIFLKEYEQNDKAHFDLSNFSNGLYILEIDAENQNLFFKIVKQ